jgi:hypothetical protein
MFSSEDRQRLETGWYVWRRRKALKLSRVQLATQAKVPLHRLVAVEEGHTPNYRPVLDRLAVVFKCPVQDLIDGTPDDIYGEALPGYRRMVKLQLARVLSLMNLQQILALRKQLASLETNLLRALITEAPDNS